jgi:hypothetical protein
MRSEGQRIVNDIKSERDMCARPASFPLAFATPFPLTFATCTPSGVASCSSRPMH